MHRESLPRTITVDPVEYTSEVYGFDSEAARPLAESKVGLGKLATQLAGMSPNWVPTSGGYHGLPSVKEFKRWKKTGEVGIAPSLQPAVPESQATRQSSSEVHSEPLMSPDEIWETYEENISSRPVASNAEPTQDEMGLLFEVDHVVKRAPLFVDQMRDTERDNQLTYVAGQRFALRVNTAMAENEPYYKTMSEQDALRELYGFLYEVTESAAAARYDREQAASMMDRLTFIGEKEYKEATSGIANMWKSELDKNPNLQIYAVAGEIAKSGNYYQESGQRQIKSDDYLLDNILSHFTDEELEQYAGRLVVDEKNVTADKPESLKVVLLDDWTISGQQLLKAKDRFLTKHPNLASSVEVQLLVASESRIKNGLIDRDHDGIAKSTTPVRAYFMAHVSEQGYGNGAHITGYHSSVDYDFENAIESMVRVARNAGEMTAMPPLTNIARPYYAKDVALTHKDRVRAKTGQFRLKAKRLFSRGKKG